MSMIIGVDVDGVLADYLTRYDTLCRTFPQDAEKTPHARAFEHISQSPSFWEYLDAYPDTPDVLRRLSADFETVFLTKRYGVRPQQQTASFLSRNGYEGHPSVLIVPTDASKGVIAKALGLAALIDDRETVLRGVRSCPGYLVDRPWNQGVRLGRGQVRVGSVGKALDCIAPPPPVTRA